MKKLSIIFSLMIMAVFFMSNLIEAKSILDDVKEKGEVRMGVFDDFRPFSYIDLDGIRKGFDVDLANAMCEKLAVKCNLITVNAKTRISHLASGMVDAAFAIMSHTKSRDEQMDFAEPSYFYTGKVFVVKKGKFKSMADLAGKKIGIQQGSNAFLAVPQELAKYSNKPAELISFPNQPDNWLALKSDKIDAWVVDAPFYLQTVGNESDKVEILGKIFSPGLYGVGVPPDDSKWRDTISFKLQELLIDGTYDKIYAKWFGPNGVLPVPFNAKPRLPEDLYGKNNAFVWPD